MSWVYRPNHPEANEHGMVDRAIAGFRESARSSLPCPSIISDIMEPTRHMATGRMHTSKAAFRAETRAAGCIEVGNEKFQPRKPVKLDRRKRRDDIRRAISDVKSGKAQAELRRDMKQG